MTNDVFLSTLLLYIILSTSVGIVFCLISIYPFYRILLQAWSYTKSDEMRVISWSPITRFLFFLTWRQSFNFLLLILFFLLSFLPIVVSYLSGEFDPYYYWGDILGSFNLYIIFGMTSLGCSIVFLQVRMGKLSYLIKASLLHIVIVPLISSPFFIELYSLANYSKWENHEIYLLRLLVYLFSFIFLVVCILFFHNRISNIDSQLGEEAT